MTDQFTPQKRSWIMSRVRGKNTKPEIIIRSLIHRLGYRFRLHRRDLPAVPDIVFPSRMKAIFVHGCFWHSHPCSRGSRMPQANKEYWQNKIARNKTRDARNLRTLKKSGWDVLVIWECQLKDEKNLVKRIINFLEGRPLKPI